MKPTLIVLIAGMMVAGCGKKQPTNTNEGSNTPAKKAEGLTKEAVVGTFEVFGGEKRIVFKPDGSVESWRGEEKSETLTWVITNGEIFIKFPPGTPGSKGHLGQYYKITADNNLEWVAVEEEGGRKEVDDLRMAGGLRIVKNPDGTPERNPDGSLKTARGGDRGIPQEARISKRIK